MGQRRRKPAEKRSAYITSEGFERLRAEFEQLWHVERPKIVRGVADAAAEGDRSENAEYIYGKKKLREIDRRLRFLGQRIEDVEVVQVDTSRDDGRVYFGAWVKLEQLEDEDETDDETDDEHREAQDAEHATPQVRVVRIVGPDEFDADRGFISMDSPMAKALMRKEEGDEITVRRPAGTTRYEIMRVRYMPFDAPPNA